MAAVNPACAMCASHHPKGNGACRSTVEEVFVLTAAKCVHRDRSRAYSPVGFLNCNVCLHDSRMRDMRSSTLVDVDSKTISVDEWQIRPTKEKSFDRGRAVGLRIVIDTFLQLFKSFELSELQTTAPGPSSLSMMLHASTSRFIFILSHRVLFNSGRSKADHAIYVFPSQTPSSQLFGT